MVPMGAPASLDTTDLWRHTGLADIPRRVPGIRSRPHLDSAPGHAAQDGRAPNRAGKARVRPFTVEGRHRIIESPPDVNEVRRRTVMEDNPLDTPSSAPVVVPVPRSVPPLYKIFHPTDLSTASEVAFVHALKLALATRGELRIMHVDPDIPQTDWSGLPRVRDTLAQWGLLPPGSSKSDVARLGLHIEKILAYHEE